MVRFEKSRLPNGIRVVSERHPDSRAVSLGLWVTTGTRDERVGQEGLSHLIEHLVFKGTKTRSAYQIAQSLESLGGDLNAYTTKEYTCYHATVLHEHWETALDVLTDLVNNMRLAPRDFLLEKGVILQEIAMSEDNHEDLIYDLLFREVYRGHSLAKPILGSVKSIAEMKRAEVMRHYRSAYGGGSIIISGAGRLNHEDLLRGVEKRLGRKARGVRPARRRKPSWKGHRAVVEKDGEQVHCLWALPTSSFKDDDRFEAFIVNAALGGGMTSRLYQAVRERRGLVYTIHSGLNTFVDCGLITIYAGVDLKNVKRLGEVVANEIRKFRREGLRASEVERFKTQIIGGLLLGADDIENRMTSLGVNEMVFERYRPVEEIVKEIEKVDRASVNRFIRKEFDPRHMAGIILGPGVGELESWWKNLEF